MSSPIAVACRVAFSVGLVRSMLLGCLAMLGLPLVAGAQIQFSATLNSIQETPPVLSPAAGDGTFTLDTTTNMLSFNITFGGLTAPETASSLHCCAPPGVAAGVVFWLPLGNQKVGQVGPLNATQVSNLQAGLFYVNIHSQQFPAGEIRGQLATSVFPGSDVLFTPECGCSWLDFASSPIPAGFFGATSLPFAATVAFHGAPLAGSGIPSTADTIVRRLTQANITSCPSSDTVQIQIVAWHLVSCDPITVFCSGGTSSTYDVEACLSTSVAQPVGSMTIQRSHQRGGTFTASLPVVPRFVFTKVSGACGSATVVMDPGPTITLGAPSAQSIYAGTWAYTAGALGAAPSPGGTVDHDGNPLSPNVAFPASSNFVPGVTYPGATCSAAGGSPAIEATVVQNSFAKLCLLPVPAPPFNGNFCYCDASSAPCGNYGAMGHGCGNNVYPGGALLTVTGTPSVVSDSIVLHATGMSGGSVIFFQGTPAISPVVLGDGLRCISTPVIRFGLHAVSNGHSSYPAPGDAAVSIRGSIPMIGGQYLYQAWYRSPAGPCGGAVNLTNGYQLNWTP